MTYTYTANYTSGSGTIYFCNSEVEKCTGLCKSATQCTSDNTFNGSTGITVFYTDSQPNVGAVQCTNDPNNIVPTPTTGYTTATFNLDVQYLSSGTSCSIEKITYS